MTDKYTPLENYLRALPDSQSEVTLDFEQIERILNGKLPPSAYEDRRWWDHATEATMSMRGRGQRLGDNFFRWTRTAHIKRIMLRVPSMTIWY